APPAEPAARRGRHPVRAGLLVLGLLVVLGAGVWFAWDYSQSRYYIGATEAGHVAIFRGVPGQIAGFDLSQPEQVSEVTLDDLTTVAQEQVRKGIQADNEADAVSRLENLIRDDPANMNILPSCPTSASPSPSATPSPGVTPTATPLPAADASSPPSEPVVPSPVPCRSN
ncbi:protein phosphatase, partial [Catellatospora aurea]